MECGVSQQELWSWIDRDAPELQAHLAECPRCRALAVELRARMHNVAAACGAIEAPLPERIASYRITGRLGEGGQGVVYRAEQHTPRRAVALKVLRGGQCAGEHDRRHFQTEIQTLAALRHPAIVTIYDAGRTNEGQHFFAMELVSGARLDQYVRGAKISRAQRLELFCRVCDGVRYAHDKGVIHRDLKPSNILVDADGNPRILDFGLARFNASDATPAQTATQTGQIVGTLRYMSPGQARGERTELDTRTDVYSLGVILYELLTDQPPYDLSPVLPVAVATICETLPRRPSAIDRALRGDLETIVLKSLEKEAARRYRSVAEFMADVQRYLAGDPIQARPPSGLYILRKKVSKYRRRLALGAALVVLNLGGGIWWTGHTLGQRRAREAVARREQVERELVDVRRELLQMQDAVERGYATGMVNKAAARYEQYPQVPEACLVTAQANFKDPQVPPGRAYAVGILESELGPSPAHWERAALLAAIYRQRDNVAQAEELEARVNRDAPDTAEAWYVRSFATLDLDVALRCAREATDRAPGWDLPWERRARLALLTANLDEALQAAQTLGAIGTERREWSLFTGQILVRQGRLADAIKLYDVLERADPRKSDSYYERGHVWRRLGQHENAVIDYTKAVVANGERASSNLWIRFQRATPLWILGHTAQAAADYRTCRASLDRPSYVDARLYIVLRDEGRVKEAATVVNKALGDVPDSEPWLKRIFACLAEQSAPDELIESAARADRAQVCEAYYYAGEAHRLAGRIELARGCFAKCVETGVNFDPRNPQSPMNEHELAQWRLRVLNENGP